MPGVNTSKGRLDHCQSVDINVHPTYFTVRNELLTLRWVLINQVPLAPFNSNCLIAQAQNPAIRLDAAAQVVTGPVATESHDICAD